MHWTLRINLRALQSTYTVIFGLSLTGSIAASIYYYLYGYWLLASSGLGPIALPITIFIVGGFFVGLFETLLESRESRTIRSDSEAAAASERQTAQSADVLTRQFHERIQKEIDAAVRNLANTSEEIIRTKLAERIDSTVGTNLVAVLGERLATQTAEEHKLQSFRQVTLDTFVQMRSRAIEYADSARRQSTFFRLAGITLSAFGLIALCVVFVQNFQQFANNPDLSKVHMEWQTIIQRGAPSYAFVALCEFLALIMFRYQSKSLEYMRYFSNEGTNLDARRIAFMSALHFSDKGAIKKLIEKLESTERNFLIGKDQRTLELANNETEDRLLDRMRRMMSLSQSRDESDDGKTPSTHFSWEVSHDSTLG